MNTINSPQSKLKVVALLPMKANSNRVKGKNFRRLAGKPLFRWILDTLLSIEVIEKVIINTDAQELLLDNGLKQSDKVIIRNRKKELCGDEVSMNLILQDDLDSVDSDLYLMTHTTNPFLKKATIISAINKFYHGQKHKCHDSLFTVNRIQSRFYKSCCEPVNHDPNNLIPTQNLEPWFEENSNLYLFTKNSFESTKARIGVKPMMLETNIMESIDIDTPEDWNLAQAVANHLSVTSNVSMIE